MHTTNQDVTVIDGHLGHAPLVCGTLDRDVLKSLQSIINELVLFKDTPVFQESYGGQSFAHNYRMTAQVNAQRAGASSFRRLAPLALRQWFAGLPDCNPGLYDGLKEMERFANSGGSGTTQRVWEHSPTDACFSLATVKHFPQGDCTTKWRIEGGPSTFLLAIVTQGRRLLQLEDRNGRVYDYEQKEGDWYVSSPSCFWHRMVTIDKGEKPVTSIALQSALLTTMIQGGRQMDDGTRKLAYAYSESSCRQSLSLRFVELLKQFSFTLNGLHAVAISSNYSTSSDPADRPTSFSPEAQFPLPHASWNVYAAPTGPPDSGPTLATRADLFAWIMQLSHHTKQSSLKRGRSYYCWTCGRCDKTLATFDKSLCLGFIPNSKATSRKIRNCVAALRASAGNTSMRTHYASRMSGALRKQLSRQVRPNHRCNDHGCCKRKDPNAT